MDEWLNRTVMALYTEACTIVRTDAGLSESFEVKVGLHQGSVLSPLLFAAVMDVVSSEARSGLPSELLYADDLVIMAPTMEQLGRRVADWRASLLGKGLRVNAGKSKVMVGSSGGKMIVNSGKWPCGVCGKGVQANSVQCTVCKKWIHKRCSGVRGDLSRVADGFSCRRCDGTIQEQQSTTHGNAPKGSGSYLRPKTHIQHTHPQHLSTSTQTSTNHKSTHCNRMG